MSNRILLIVAGWEERFLLGAKRDIEDFQPERVVVLFSDKYAEWTSQHRASLQEICDTTRLPYSEFNLDFSDPIHSFPQLGLILNEQLPQSLHVRFNGTTTPRDIIWTVLHILSARGDQIEFSYYQVEGYGEWLSRDAEVPRLVIKRSGLMYPDLNTCLLVLSGYDDHRLGQLIRKFEPRKVLVGRQIGQQLGNAERNRPDIKDFGTEIEFFEFDCLDPTSNSEQSLIRKLEPLTESYNIVAASLGPKPSAAILFKVTNKLPSIGLVYIPAKEYNIAYSNGADLDHPYLVNI
jgi:hypothetical protein